MGYYKILVRFLEKKGDKSYFRIFIVSAIGPEDAILLLLRMFPTLSGIDNVSFEYILRIELSSKDSDIKEAIKKNGYFASGKVYYNEKERDKLLLLFPYFCVPAQKLSDKNLNRIHIGYKKKRLDNGLIEFQGNIKLKDIEKLFFDFLQTIIKTNILTFIIASDVKKKEDATKRFIVSKKKLFIFLKNNFGDIITNGHLGFGIVDESKNIELYINKEREFFVWTKRIEEMQDFIQRYAMEDKELKFISEFEHCNFNFSKVSLDKFYKQLKSN